MTLKSHQGEPIVKKGEEVPNKIPNKWKEQYPEIPIQAWNVLDMIRMNPTISANEAGRLLNLSPRMIRKYISVLKAAGLLERVGSNKSGYWKLREDEA